ncbi:probable 2-oxoglutarate-dependent dioxygenase AOP1.2 [Lolium rigidum]|uniref:probable 2-oxoglutarate-dependent dioxygenase AOP1.2 n=1 Tax=Lolium rigidum TaxID=89674 RepID=UPI001F5E033F|nr:probable 2-oxoglutarate-dependent dioxygenase AOP1.2 [Lolium rigidum]
MATSLPAPALMIPPRVDLDGDDPSTLVRGTPEWLRETLTSTATETTRLARVILAMVIDSYGLAAHRSDEIVGTTDANFRMLRYCKDSVGTSPPPDEQPAVALAAHVDGSYLTVLFQNDVDGFELKKRNGGEWVRVRPPGPDSLLVVAGQALMAWSNGRVHAPFHRVVAVGGREDRLSCGVFLQPTKNFVVDAPPELVTADTPRRFRPFEYVDYLRFKHTAGNSNGDDVLHRFAGM